MNRRIVICDYCGEEAELVTGAQVYPHMPRLAEKVLYQCTPCQARVGCHPGTDKPLGRLANIELRQAKERAHAAFDPLWQTKMRQTGMPKSTARSLAYKWLAREMGLSVDDCHIGMFDIAQCRRVIEICAPYRRAA